MKAVEAPAYWIDRYEVTNRQFKEFVDQGGYQNREHWPDQFMKDGQTISWERAMRDLRDKTKLPGPSTWAGGTYPEGQDDYPVAGVSWYEAAAYARFSGKSLPTVYHWTEAADTGEAAAIVRFSNFGAKGSAAVGTHPGMGITGLYDMAGNVKEWCHNATDETGERRYILGGAWGEPTYMFTDKDARSPWDRFSTNGFRCIQWPGGQQLVPEALFRPIERKFPRDYRSLTPASDETFRFYKNELYSYDATDLKAEVESVDDSWPFWRREKITFAAAYGSERVLAFLFLPKGFEPPYQTIVYFPHAGWKRGPFEGLEQRPDTEFVIRSGRALMFPVYKGTYDRHEVHREGRIASRDSAIQRAQDLRRSLDYLQARDDIDKENIGYYGVSSGAGLGPLHLAVDDRLKLGVLLAAHSGESDQPFRLKTTGCSGGFRPAARG